MQCSILISLIALGQSTLGQSLVDLRDPRETKDCIGWFHVQDVTVQTCEWTLRKHELDLERFRAWNPSVGLDCKPWIAMNYCVLTNSYLADSVNTTTLYKSDQHEGTFAIGLPALTTDEDGWTIPVTRSDAPSRTYSTRAPIPSPSTWTDKGCFIDEKSSLKIPQNESVWILEFYSFRGLLGGRSDETLDTCKQLCWELKYPIAGVKDGGICFCGDRNIGTLAKDQGECNTPCAGDASVMCGGTNRTNVWEAEGYVQSTAAAGATTGPEIGNEPASRTDGSEAAETMTSGARRNAPMFWQM